MSKKKTPDSLIGARLLLENIHKTQKAKNQDTADKLLAYLKSKLHTQSIILYGVFSTKFDLYVTIHPDVDVKAVKESINETLIPSGYKITKIKSVSSWDCIGDERFIVTVKIII